MAQHETGRQIDFTNCMQTNSVLAFLAGWKEYWNYGKIGKTSSIFARSNKHLKDQADIHQTPWYFIWPMKEKIMFQLCPSVCLQDT